MNDVTAKGRMGFTTGACAAAAVKAALLCLAGGEAPDGSVEVPFPDGCRRSLPVSFARSRHPGAEAGVIKDAGDDPDITHGALIQAFVEWGEGDPIVWVAGEGVGTVTRKGLSLPPGEPAINPGPRNMIREAVREVTKRPVRITLSIPGGRRLAGQTYNPRLGIVNGLSVLGTTGRVRPFSCRALRCSVRLELNVAHAAGIRTPVLVPGHIGEKSARRHLDLAPTQVIEVGNEWGYLLESFRRYAWDRVLLWGHPGKLAKLAAGWWDTHSSRSRSAVEVVRHLAIPAVLRDIADHSTLEGLFQSLDPDERHRLAVCIAAAVGERVAEKIRGKVPVAVGLIDIRGDLLGTYGDISVWLPLTKTGS